MKWFLLFVGMFFASGYVHAEARFNSVGNFYEWRSTETCAAVTNFQVATGAVFVSEISVSSGGTGSSLYISNSTGTGISPTRSTSAIIMVDSVNNFYRRNSTLSQGLNFTKSGTSCIRIKWDWYFVPGGKESEGWGRP